MLLKLLGNKPIRTISLKCRMPLPLSQMVIWRFCMQTLIAQRRLWPLLQLMVWTFVILRQWTTWQITVQSNSRALKLFLDSQSFLISDVFTAICRLLHKLDTLDERVALSWHCAYVFICRSLRIHVYLMFLWLQREWPDLFLVWSMAHLRTAGGYSLFQARGT